MVLRLINISIRAGNQPLPTMVDRGDSLGLNRPMGAIMLPLFNNRPTSSILLHPQLWEP
jgi:hypothetical protein